MHFSQLMQGVFVQVLGVSCYLCLDVLRDFGTCTFQQRNQSVSQTGLLRPGYGLYHADYF